MRSSAVATAAFLACALSAEPAGAQSDASSLEDQGVELHRAGRDVEAVAVLERALAIAKTPRTLAQVGLAEQSLGLWVEAERDLEAALIEGQGPWFEQNDRALRSALETIHGHLASVELESNVPGAEVRINGRLVGATPLDRDLRVVAGPLVIEVRATHYRTKTLELRVEPSSIVHEEVDLLPAAALTSAAHETQVAVTPREPSSIGPGPAPWIALGGGVVFLATAGIAWIVRESDVALYDDDARCFYGGLTRDQRCGGYRTTALVAQVVSIASLGLAVGSFVASGVLFARSPQPRALGGSTLQCTVALTVGCWGAF